MGLEAEGGAVEHDRGALRRDAGRDTDAEAVDAIGGAEQGGEIGKMQPDVAFLLGDFGGVGAGLVDRGDRGHQIERVGRGAETNGVTDAETQFLAASRRSTAMPGACACAACGGERQEQDQKTRHEHCPEDSGVACPKSITAGLKGCSKLR